MGTRGKREAEPHGVRLTVGANVSRLMADKSISAREVAAKAKMDRRTVDRLRKGEVAPNLDTIGHLADALGAQPVELFIDRGQTSMKGEEPTLFHGKLFKTAERNKRRKNR